MGAWSLLLAIGLCLVFLGLFTHWSIMAFGAALPFIPVVMELIKRRRLARRPGPQADTKPDDISI
ncbi:MAG: hypothetical protein QY320_04575 [Gammaproteobacteria bacterium]|nr:MAG: hypothetical protein QY320_04575 [Gammaproteobacteria bacterium]